MNDRRNFLKNLLVAGAGFMILPGAAREWKKENSVYLLVGTTTGRLSSGPNIQRCSYEWYEIVMPTIYIDINGNTITAEQFWNRAYAKVSTRNPSL